MNTVWSTYVQRIGTLYSTRSLRFSDIFKEQYITAFGIANGQRILEIGCGPGALSGALHRWYPDSEIIGVDRDSDFIEYAEKTEPAITFLEEDATRLSFSDESFDVTISNTVAEHIEPSKFFGEQYRVLKRGGICIVLSSRKSINHTAPCISKQSDFEKEIWKKCEKKCSEMDKKLGVCLYPMSEAEYPRLMEEYGFRNIATEYVTVNLTPDNPANSAEAAYAIIDANRQTQLDGIDLLKNIASDIVDEEEIAELKRLTDKKYDKRLELYDLGKKQWDTNVNIIMMIRGIK